ncbi:MAG: chemotaxis-specific protein-glutamate methyltransferase CheB [Actinobacteria bacterium]|nr:chemotaxis-specific protein-glutamate methyltransferase CheB [Actinomycetota bacterium]
MIRVLVVDDSAVVRQVLSRGLCKARDIEVVATAVDAYAARDKIVRLRPDVVTLDLDMPRMDGLTFLTKLMKYYPLPVIVVSALSPKGSEVALRALELGAVDVVAKPGSGDSVARIVESLVDKIRAAACSSPQPLFSHRQTRQVTKPPAMSSPNAANKVIAIGASTGGTEAIRNVLSALPVNVPGLVIVQHMPAGLTATFAQRVNEICLIEVREAKNGDLVQPGIALIAPGNYHMTLRRSADNYRIEIKSGPPVFHQRPSVDVLFHSVARQVGPDAVGVILTGMGADGSGGMLAMRKAGAHTIAQDQASSVVFGMPKEAIRLGAAQKVVSLARMSQQILHVVCRGANYLVHQAS